MNVWVKLLIGSVLGIFLGNLLPFENAALAASLEWLAELAIRIGRYGLVPLLVFSIAIAVHELREDGQFRSLVAKTLIAMVICSAAIIAAGLFVTVRFSRSRIPILVEEQAEAFSLNTASQILELFPANMFSAVFGGGAYILPACVCAVFLGVGISYGRGFSKPTIALVDSFSRIFYSLAAFFSEVLGIVMIVLSAFWAVRFSAVMRAEIYRDLILFLGLITAALGFLVLPFLLYLVRPQSNPWLVLYGSLGQAIAAFFSGDINFTLPVLFRHIKENLGTRRRANVITVTLMAMFGRSGSAMLASSALIVIIRSYTSLDIPLQDLISIGVRAFGVSFLLSGQSGTGAFAALAVLCRAYGHGFETGYLILKPLAFYLITLGAFLDIMITTFVSYALCSQSGLQEHKELRKFI